MCSGRARKGADAGDVDRVVAAEHHGHRPSGEDGADAGFDVGVGGFSVGMNDVGIADVQDADAFQVGHVVFVVIGPGVAEGEERRSLTDAAGAEAGPGAELGAEVERRAEDGEVGVDRGPVGL